MICSDYNIAYTRRRFLKPCLSSEEIRQLEALERLCFPPQDRYDFRTLRLFVSLNGIGVLRYYEESLPERPLVAFHMFDCLTAELITLDVHPHHRGKGIGSHLISLSLEKLRSLGHTRATCEISVGNVASLNLHKKFGFKPIKLLRNYYGAGRHAYLLRTSLRQPTRSASITIP
ncbi:MAG: GNAT family N-acetyltransferase [Candidatus Sumerlaeaceae bacterium]|nr:GNAT family N-acetyltransferase [Candidatus Sumerlaeaceae bacterium]